MSNLTELKGHPPVFTKAVKFLIKHSDILLIKEITSLAEEPGPKKSLIKSRVYYLTAASKYEAGVITPSRLVMRWPKNSWTKHDWSCYHQPESKSYRPASAQRCATKLITVETSMFQMSVAVCVHTSHIWNINNTLDVCAVSQLSPL